MSELAERLLDLRALVLVRLAGRAGFVVRLSPVRRLLEKLRDDERAWEFIQAKGREVMGKSRGRAKT